MGMLIAPMSTGWTTDRITNQNGNVFVITGANSGLGFEAARALAGKGAHVVLACRDSDKSNAAVQTILRQHPRANVDAVRLDLGSLASVRACASSLTKTYPVIHGLVNNAGIMAVPYGVTVEGFEMQFGTNHLGHFALTGLLLPNLLAAPGSRVVHVSSLLHRRGRLQFDDLQGRVSYSKSAAYAQSKLANVLFAYELQRRLAARSALTTSIACHPGYSATNLQLVGPRMERAMVREWASELTNHWIAQSAAMGALPILYAATADNVQGGDFIGPDGAFELRGYPKKLRSSKASYNESVAKKLWEVSEELTGTSYLLLSANRIHRCVRRRRGMLLW